MNKKKILITTAIDYANDVIHIGHGYEKVAADAFARFFRASGREVYFVIGTDEHGGNIEEIANQKGISPKEYVDEISKADKKEFDSLNVSYDRFIRTTDLDHKERVIEFWKKSAACGDIYLGDFTGWYCNGCEAFKTSIEIVDGKCILHPTKKLQEVNEKNYFFRWSKYQSFLEKLFKNNPRFILPESRGHEMLSFLKQGIEDITISRENVSWGIPVPDDSTQVIYVWFDALINYYTAAVAKGFWDETTDIVHILGKDNLRWHALLWPAILKSVGLRLPDTVYAHGFINLNGQKISKSLGNVIKVSELVEKFGSDGARYVLLKLGPWNEDADISWEKFTETYNADLANGIGNLVQRVATLCEKNNLSFPHFTLTISQPIIAALESFSISQAIEAIRKSVSEADQFINENAPWKKSGKELEEILSLAVNQIRQIGKDIEPFLPAASKKIAEIFNAQPIKTAPALFKRTN